MAKKRKSENAALDEVERTLYTSFCAAANSISQLYTQSQHQQKLAFQAGERHCAEKLYNWLHREHQAGSNFSMSEILNFLQNELDGEEMTMSPGPQFQQQQQQQHQALQQQQHQQQQHQQQQQQLLSSNNQAPASVVGFPGLGNVGRMGGAVDQSKISVFAGALSSPNRRSLPPFAVAQGGYGSGNNISNAGNGGRRSGGGADQHHEEDEDSPTATGTQPYQSSSLPAQNHSVNSVYGYNQQPGQHRESQSFLENDSSMDMHADGGSEDYYQ